VCILLAAASRSAVNMNQPPPQRAARPLCLKARRSVRDTSHLRLLLDPPWGRPAPKPDVSIVTVIMNTQLLDGSVAVKTTTELKNGVFWDVTPCGPCMKRRFGGT
jgi:hypothetical protein